jgi:hypothetical protein
MWQAWSSGLPRFFAGLLALFSCFVSCGSASTRLWVLQVCQAVCRGKIGPITRAIELHLSAALAEEELIGAVHLTSIAEALAHKHVLVLHSSELIAQCAMTPPSSNVQVCLRNMPQRPRRTTRFCILIHFSFGHVGEAEQLLMCLLCYHLSLGFVIPDLGRRALFGMRLVMRSLAALASSRMMPVVPRNPLDPTTTTLRRRRRSEDS